MIQILIAAITIGLGAGFAWSKMLPVTAPPAMSAPAETFPARPDDIASPTPRPAIRRQPQLSADDREWARRAARPTPSPAASISRARSRSAVQSSVYYAGCYEVRAAGKAPLYAGQPGYRSGMDGDGDGIACEPYRGR